MSYQTSSTITRPTAENSPNSVLTDWYTPTDAFLTHMTNNYIDTNKMIDNSKTASADGLTMTHTVTWDSSDSVTEWYNDSVCTAHLTARKEYEDTNGFVRVDPRGDIGDDE